MLGTYRVSRIAQKFLLEISPLQLFNVVVEFRRISWGVATGTALPTPILPTQHPQVTHSTPPLTTAQTRLS